MNSVLEPLLKSPLLPDLLKQAQSLVDEEAEARARFLKEITPEMKAEFIQGETVMHSPARLKHLEVTGNFIHALLSYTKNTGNGCAFVEKCLVSLTRNDFEPDIVWFSSEKAAAFTPDQMRFPAPDFIVEILSDSTADRDRGIKLLDYALHRVSEYWIVDPEARTVEQYLLKDGAQEYHLAEKLAHGTALSKVIAGFEIDLEPLFS
jgi:Uma2 family endonuclease